MRAPFATAAVTVCCLLSVPAFAQPGSTADTAEVDVALATLRPEAIRAHMRFLSDDLFEGRRTGTRGYDLAAKYVASRFEALGLEPAGAAGSYFQPVPMVRMTRDNAWGSLAFVRGGERTVLVQGEDYLADLLSEAEGEVTAPMVFVGHGVSAPELGHDDYQGVDVRGKVVVLLRSGPPTFSPDQRAYYSDRRVLLRMAAEHGAVGAVFLTTPENERVYPWTAILRGNKPPALAWSDEAGRPRDMPPAIRGVATLSPKATERFFAGAPRSLEQVLEASRKGELKPFPFPGEMSLRSISRRERAESPNVAAVLRGSDPRLRDEYVVLSAHLDHVGVGEPINGDGIYNGAIDNASGIAYMIEIAGALARLPVAPRRSVLLLAVTGEEVGLHGSDYYARHATVPLERIVANVNLDMHVMLYPLRDVIAIGGEHSSLGETVKQAAARLGLGVSPDPFPEMVTFIRSDHYSFVKQGVPAVSLMGGFETGDPAKNGQEIAQQWMHQIYHQPGDDMSQALDFEAAVSFAKLHFLITYLVAQGDERPSWNPGDFFGETFRRR